MPTYANKDANNLSYGANDPLKHINPILLLGERIHHLVCHDESIFHTNEMQCCMWLKDGEQPLKSKGNG
jgi:hypothetical protein